MSQPLVLDASALVALFDAYEPMYRIWTWANDGQVLLVVPAAAIADANRSLRAPHDAWSSILRPDHVVPTALTEEVAAEIGPWGGSLAARHVVYEAQAVRGIVVTRSPQDYQAGTVPLLVV